MSFNLGSLGFLTTFKYEDMHADLERCLNDGYRANMRMRFTCTVYRSVKRSTEVLESEQFDVFSPTLFSLSSLSDTYTRS